MRCVCGADEHDPTAPPALEVAQVVAVERVALDPHLVGRDAERAQPRPHGVLRGVVVVGLPRRQRDLPAVVPLGQRDIDDRTLGVGPEHQLVAAGPRLEHLAVDHEPAPRPSGADHRRAERLAHRARAAVGADHVADAQRVRRALLVDRADGHAVRILLQPGERVPEPDVEGAVVRGVLADHRLHLRLVDHHRRRLTEDVRLLHQPEHEAVLVGLPAHRRHLVHVGLDPFGHAELLQDAQGPVVHGDGTCPRVQVHVPLEHDRRHPGLAEHARGDDPGRSVADDGDLGVEGLHAHPSHLPLVQNCTDRSS